MDVIFCGLLSTMFDDFSGLLSPVVAIPPQIWSNDDHLQA
jgi:hypothetical protein